MTGLTLSAERAEARRAHAQRRESEEEMDVAVVYESLFGNTRLVAEAIADGIRAADPAARVSVKRTDATKLGEVDDACLLVVGGPTHMLRMTSPHSRQQGL